MAFFGAIPVLDSRSAGEKQITHELPHTCRNALEVEERKLLFHVSKTNEMNMFHPGRSVNHSRRYLKGLKMGIGFLEGLLTVRILVPIKGPSNFKIGSFIFE